MLKAVNSVKPIAGLPIRDASYPAPFVSGLEYASPARGTWNIVHTGMLIPEAHEIFVCAASCLRGVVLTAAEVKALTLSVYPGADLSGDPSGWFGEARRGEGETVSSILLGGVTLTGSQVRGLFSLRSAAFTVTWDGTNFTFDVTGYGHGVGMSQYGANELAREGRTWQEILTWYYSGAAIENLADKALDLG